MSSRLRSIRMRTTGRRETPGGCASNYPSVNVNVFLQQMSTVLAVSERDRGGKLVASATSFYETKHSEETVNRHGLGFFEVRLSGFEAEASPTLHSKSWP